MLVASGLVTLRVAEPIVELAAEATSGRAGPGDEARLEGARSPVGLLGRRQGQAPGAAGQGGGPGARTGGRRQRSSPFRVTVGTDAPPGPHKNVFCELQGAAGRRLGDACHPADQLRIDKPLPPEEPAPPPAKPQRHAEPTPDRRRRHDPATHQPSNPATLQPFNPSSPSPATLQPCNPSTLRPSTLQPSSATQASKPSPSSVQPCNSSLQPFNPSTLQPFNPSTLQPFNPTPP